MIKWNWICLHFKVINSQIPESLQFWCYISSGSGSGSGSGIGSGSGSGCGIGSGSGSGIGAGSGSGSGIGSGSGSGIGSGSGSGIGSGSGSGIGSGSGSGIGSGSGSGSGIGSGSGSGSGSALFHGNHWFHLVSLNNLTSLEICHLPSNRFPFDKCILNNSLWKMYSMHMVLQLLILPMCYLCKFIELSSVVNNMTEFCCG